MAATRKSAARKPGTRKYGKSAARRVGSVLHRAKHGSLKRGKAGHGGTVKSRKQAIAIGLSEARKKGTKLPAASASRGRRQTVAVQPRRHSVGARIATQG